MALTGGYICINRSVCEVKGIDGIVLRYLVVTANYEDVPYGGFTIRRGQTLTSIKLLKEALGLSDKTIRCALDRLAKGGEVVKQTACNGTMKGRKSGSLLTVVKYDSYVHRGRDEGQTKDIENGKDTAQIRATKKEVKSKGNQSSINADDGVKAVPFEVPSHDAFTMFIHAEGLDLDPESTYKYFQKMGWKDGNGQPVNNWKSYVRHFQLPPHQSEPSRIKTEHSERNVRNDPRYNKLYLYFVEKDGKPYKLEKAEKLCVNGSFEELIRQLDEDCVEHPPIEELRS